MKSEQLAYDDASSAFGWLDHFEALYERAVALLQDVARGLITPEDALRELGERVP